MIWRSLLALLVAGLGGCGDLAKAEGDPCSHGSECVWPAVCCSVEHFSGASVAPFCAKSDRCPEPMPPLLEGHPCHRGTGRITECAEPWICCAQSRTCLSTEVCAEVPEPEPTVSSGDRCHADSDCGPGEICAGINLAWRDGTCAALVEAAASSMRSAPPPTQ